jgi:hypothetical protein
MPEEIPFSALLDSATARLQDVPMTTWRRLLLQQATDWRKRRLIYATVAIYIYMPFGSIALIQARATSQRTHKRYQAEVERRGIPCAKRLGWRNYCNSQFLSPKRWDKEHPLLDCPIRTFCFCSLSVNKPSQQP